MKGARQDRKPSALGSAATASDTGDVRRADGKWKLCAGAAAIVLAGGESRRMGTDKAFVRIGGEPAIKHLCMRLVPHFGELLISANDTGKFAFLGVPVVPDRIRSQGPLMAIASALAASHHDLNLVVACDIPDPDMVVAEKMLGLIADFDAVLPVDSSGQLQPLFAVYNKKIVSKLEKALTEGGRRIIGALDGCEMLRLELDALPPILNLNTINEYEDYVRKSTAFF